MTTDRKLDRLIRFDEKSRAYAIVRGLDDFPLRGYTWRCSVWLDQGREGACVEYALGHELVARPAMVNEQTVRELVGRHGIYWPAQKRDPYAGGAYPGANPYMEGTSVLSGVQVVHEMGYYGGYGWAFGEHQMAMGIGYKGPAVLGVNWTTGMFDTDVDGYIKPTGAIEGGHAIVCPKVSVSGDYYELHNSWGKGWGVNGRARMKRGAMAELLTADGECCFPTIRRLTPSPLG